MGNRKWFGRWVENAENGEKREKQNCKTFKGEEWCNKQKWNNVRSKWYGGQSPNNIYVDKKHEQKNELFGKTQSEIELQTLRP